MNFQRRRIRVEQAFYNALFMQLICKQTYLLTQVSDRCQKVFCCDYLVRTFTRRYQFHRTIIYYFLLYCFQLGILAVVTSNQGHVIMRKRLQFYHACFSIHSEEFQVLASDFSDATQSNDFSVSTLSGDFSITTQSEHDITYWVPRIHSITFEYS